MKSRFTLILIALAVLNLAACGQNTGSVNTPTVVINADGYNASLSEGIQFGTKQNYPAFIKSVTGMSAYEEGHRWSEGKKVIFTFAQNLPANFVLDLDINSAFGPNTGKSIQIKVGSWNGQFVADSAPNKHKLSVETSVPTDSIEFIIPDPKSPKDLGMGEDARQLGIAFTRLSIANN